MQNNWEGLIVGLVELGRLIFSPALNIPLIFYHQKVGGEIIPAVSQ